MPTIIFGIWARQKNLLGRCWCWVGSMAGLKPKCQNTEKAVHIIDILTKVNSAQTFNTGQSASIMYKITSKHRLLTSHKAGSIYYVHIS